MKKTLIFGLLLLAFSGCKSDEGTRVESDPAVETTSTAAQPAEIAEPPAPAADEGAAEGTFGGYVEGATTLTVTQRMADGEADYGGTPRTVEDPEWIDKFVTAIGPDQPGSEAVPKCLPTYTLVFAGPDGELATFGGVCGGSDVILVRDGASYAADDDATALLMLQELAGAEAEQ